MEQYENSDSTNSDNVLEQDILLLRINSINTRMKRLTSAPVSRTMGAHRQSQDKFAVGERQNSKLRRSTIERGTQRN